MANGLRVAERTGCEQYEDFGLTFDLLRPEVVLPIRPLALTGSHLDDLATTIESAIIPRLLLSHGFAGTAVNILSPVTSIEIAPETVEQFTQLLFSADNAEPTDYVEELVGNGLQVERVLLDVLAPSARLLGDMWTADKLSFVDVTLGLSRIQQVLRQVRGMAGGYQSNDAGRGRALLVPAPGEQHTFGLRVVEEFLLRDGWEVRSNLKASPGEVLDLVRDDHYDFVGFSLSGEVLLPGLQSVIADVRKSSRNGAIRVMVGGVLFLEHPEHASEVDADIAIRDAQHAVDIANEWYAAAQMN